MALTRYLCIGLCVVAAINALAFAAWTAIPLPAADAWHFIDTFVRNALQGNLQLADFFAQRVAGDHSQPLHRLVLLAHLRLFDLDFRIEALVGIALGVVTCSVLAATLLAGKDDRRDQPYAFLGAAAIFAVGLSLNATNIYSWSLVSLIWISLLIAVLYWMVVALPLHGVRFMAAMAAATLVMAVVLDELALPTFAAAVAALLFRDGVWRPKRSLVLLLSGGAGLAVARWFIHHMASGAADAAGDGRFSQLLEVLRDPQVWKLIVAPLSDSLLHQEHLVTWLPSSVVGAQVAIAFFLAMLHIAFWWRALVSPERPRETIYVIAVAMMLFFYASVAGIALSRVTQFGIEYVHQPRYTAVYQLNVIALVLMFAGSVRAASVASVRQPIATATLVFLTAVLVLQLPLASKAWVQGKYIRNYSQNAAVALAKLGTNPGVEPAPKCPSILTVCNRPSLMRVGILGLLKEHRLSIYSVRFRHANDFEGLQLDVVSVPAGDTTLAKACDITILRRGPTQVVRGKPFNSQPNGKSAFWMLVPPEAAEFTVEFERERLPITRRAGVVTYYADDRQLAAIDAGRPLQFDVLCGGSKITSFEVAIR